MAKVSLQNVSKVYKGEGSRSGQSGQRGNNGAEVTAVRDFNLEIADREFVVFVGPSGCGKSTTLRMVAGLEGISGGEIAIDGRVVNDVPPKDRDIAMVFQNYALYPHMTVYENLAFGLKLRRYPKAEIDRRVRDAAAILGIEPYLDRRPKALSGGQQQRVAVGRAIVRQPKVFLFDEPLSNLDAKMRTQMRREIVKLHQRLQATMIYVTHDQVEAMTMGDRIVVMKEGVIQQIDAPLKLYHAPENLFVAGFLGSPPMNFLHGELRTSGGRLLFRETGEGAVELAFTGRPELEAYAGRNVVLGVRAENVRPLPGEGGKPTGGSRFQAVVEGIEPMGAETYFHAQTGEHVLICRSENREGGNNGNGGEIGRRMQFEVDLERVHFFDPDTTRRIAP